MYVVFYFADKMDNSIELCMSIDELKMMEDQPLESPPTTDPSEKLNHITKMCQLKIANSINGSVNVSATPKKPTAAIVARSSATIKPTITSTRPPPSPSQLPAKSAIMNKLTFVNDNDVNNLKYKTCVNGEYDDDDDYDDHINVTFRNKNKLISEDESKLISEDESNKISVISNNKNLTNNPKYNSFTHNVNVDTSIIEINHEIEKIIKISLETNNKKMITVRVNGSILLIPNDVEISSKLANEIWPPPAESILGAKFPNMDIVNQELKKHNNNETYGFFSALYKKPIEFVNNIISKSKIPVRDLTSNRSNTARMLSSGLYQYIDFTLFIIKNGKIIDYATHGVINNINYIVDYYNPKCIYYRCNESLQCFLEYPQQPFYNAFKNKLCSVSVPITIQTNTPVIMFCLRGLPFCSFCTGLEFIYNYYNSLQDAVNIDPTSTLKQLQRYADIHNEEPQSYNKKPYYLRHHHPTSPPTKNYLLPTPNYLKPNQLSNINTLLTMQPSRHPYKRFQQPQQPRFKPRFNNNYCVKFQHPTTPNNIDFGVIKYLNRYYNQANDSRAYYKPANSYRAHYKL